MKLFFSSLLVCVFSCMASANDFLQDEREAASLQQTEQKEREALEAQRTGGYDVTDQTGGSGLSLTGEGTDKGSMVKVLGMAMGAAYMTKCVKPTGQWACPLAAMSFMDAAAGSSAAGVGRNTSAAIGGYGNGTGGGPAGNAEKTVEQSQIDESLNQLSEMGYTANPNGSVTGPNGENYTPGSYANEEALMGQGMSSGQAQSVMEQMQGVSSAAAKTAGIDPAALGEGDAGGTESSAGRGVASTGAAFSDGGGTAQIDSIVEEIEYRGGKKKKKLDKLPAGVAADLATDFHGSPIGIGMANIFLIVHKKYKKKKKEKEFLTREY